MRLEAAAASAALALGLLGVTLPAQAFERQWHLGGGAGVSTANGLSLSPALGMYAAYGLSDVFDTRLELTLRGYQVGSEQDPNGLSAMVGLVYKLDVLSWVPWGGVYVGYQGFDSAPREGLVFERHAAVLGWGLGLDYGWSRSFGLGVTLRLDDALSRAEAATFDALLRAEYRWGW